MVESSDTSSSAYISTEQLADMIANQPAASLCILNASCKPENECDNFR